MTYLFFHIKEIYMVFTYNYYSFLLNAYVDIILPTSLGNLNIQMEIPLYVVVCAL